jgi:hypothetical protein
LESREYFQAGQELEAMSSSLRNLSAYSGHDSRLAEFTRLSSELETIALANLSNALQNNEFEEFHKFSSTLVKIGLQEKVVKVVVEKKTIALKMALLCDLKGGLDCESLIKLILSSLTETRKILLTCLDLVDNRNNQATSSLPQVLCGAFVEIEPLLFECILASASPLESFVSLFVFWSKALLELPSILSMDSSSPVSSSESEYLFIQPLRFLFAHFKEILEIQIARDFDRGGIFVWSKVLDSSELVFPKDLNQFFQTFRELVDMIPETFIKYFNYCRQSTGGLALDQLELSLTLFLSQCHSVVTKFLRASMKAIIAPEENARVVELSFEIYRLSLSLLNNLSTLLATEHDRTHESTSQAFVNHSLHFHLLIGRDINTHELLKDSLSSKSRIHEVVAATKHISDSCRDLVLHMLCVKMKASIAKILTLKEWDSVVKRSLLGLPSFASNPSDYVVEIGEEMISIAQQLEIHHAPSGSQDAIDMDNVLVWLQKVGDLACEMIVESVLKIPTVSSKGSKQLIIDLDHFLGVFKVLGLAPTSSLTLLREAYEAPKDSIKDLISRNPDEEALVTKIFSSRKF